MAWGRDRRKIRSAACLGAFAFLFALGLFVACGKKATPQGAAYDGPLATQDAAMAIYKKVQENITSINPWPLAKIGG